MLTYRPATKAAVSFLKYIGMALLMLSIVSCSKSEEEKMHEESKRAAAMVEQAHKAQAGITAQPYKIEIAQSSKSNAMVALGGSVIPKTELTIRSQAPGRVVYIAGDEGTAVRSGEVIVDLDQKSLQAQRRAAIAGIQRSRAQLNNAYIQLDQNIISDGHSSKGGMGVPSMFDYFVTNNVGDAMGVGDSDYDRYASISASRATVEQAKSNVLEAESQLDQVEAMFRDKQAIAPEDAIILEKMIELGDAVQPGQPLLRIGDVTSLQVIIDVPARLIRGLKEGMLLSINLDNTTEIVEGEIVRIFPAADIKRNTVRFKLALPPNTNATPGMYATVSVPDSNSSNITYIMLPSTAVVWRGSQASVYVVNSAGQAELRMIRIGTESKQRISVLSGITEGDRVVTTPDTHLRSGTIIQTIMATPAQSRIEPRHINISMLQVVKLIAV